MIGSAELIVILCIVLILFGGKKLPEFAKNLGKGIREFKKACNGHEEEEMSSEKSKCDVELCCKPIPTERPEEK